MTKFAFTPTEPFDARGGYTRFVPPGAGARGEFQANADIWRDREGQVVARFGNFWGQWSYLVTQQSGKEVDDSQMPMLCDRLIEILESWVTEGPADVEPI